MPENLELYIFYAIFLVGLGAFFFCFVIRPIMTSKISPKFALGHKILQVFGRKNIRLLKETSAAIVVHFKGGMQFSVHATTEGLKSLGTMLSVIGLALQEVGYDKASVYWQGKSVVVDFGDGSIFTLTCEFDGDGKPWLDGRG